MLLAPALASAAPIAPSAVAIERRPVQSTHLASVGYDAPARLLEIEFHNGAVYRYLDVPPATVDALLHAESKGHYFARFIRGRFQFRLLTKGTP